MTIDPYKVLRIGTEASTEEIKKAYRAMARKHHPDNGGNAEYFKRVQEAYELLMERLAESNAPTTPPPAARPEDVDRQRRKRKYDKRNQAKRNQAKRNQAKREQAKREQAKREQAKRERAKHEQVNQQPPPGFATQGHRKPKQRPLQHASFGLGTPKPQTLKRNSPPSRNPARHKPTFLDPAVLFLLSVIASGAMALFLMWNYLDLRGFFASFRPKQTAEVRLEEPKPSPTPKRPEIASPGLDGPSVPPAKSNEVTPSPEPPVEAAPRETLSEESPEFEWPEEDKPASPSSKPDPEDESDSRDLGSAPDVAPEKPDVAPEPAPQLASPKAPPGGSTPMAEAQAKIAAPPSSVILGQPIENSVGMEFQLIAPGILQRENDQNQIVKVPLAKPFYLGIYEVTQAQYRKVMKDNPSRLKHDNQPVEQVSWNDAVEFCRTLSDLPEERKLGLKYRLPTEAELEYACRAGSKSKFCFGKNAAAVEAFGWYEGNSSNQTREVGGKAPNPWGLYDMLGNVREWCDGRQGARAGVWGAAYDSPLAECNSATISLEDFDSRSSCIGFRVVCVSVGETGIEEGVKNLFADLTACRPRAEGALPSVEFFPALLPAEPAQGDRPVVSFPARPPAGTELFLKNTRQTVGDQPIDFQLVPVEENDRRKAEWLVSAVTPAKAGEPQMALTTKPIGKFKLEEEALRFEWLISAGEIEQASALRQCLLGFRAGEQETLRSLGTPLKLSLRKLDPKALGLVYPLNLTNLSADDTIIWRIGPIETADKSLGISSASIELAMEETTTVLAQKVGGENRFLLRLKSRRTDDAKLALDLDWIERLPDGGEVERNAAWFDEWFSKQLGKLERARDDANREKQLAETVRLKIEINQARQCQRVIQRSPEFEIPVTLFHDTPSGRIVLASTDPPAAKPQEDSQSAGQGGPK